MFLSHLRFQERREKEQEFFAFSKIIEEKLDAENGAMMYLVEWKGTQRNGEPHAPSWVGEDFLRGQYIFLRHSRTDKNDIARCKKEAALRAQKAVLMPRYNFPHLRELPTRRHLTLRLHAPNSRTV